MKRVMMMLALVGVTACGSSHSSQEASPPKPPLVLDATTESTSTTTAPPPTTTTTPPTTQPLPKPPATGVSTVDPPATSVGAVPAMGGFQACVALRESGNNPHIGGGLYGILDSTWRSLGYGGHARDADVGTQTQAFWRLYARYGVQPWRPYDGC